MKIQLIAKYFINRDITNNLDVILQTIKSAKDVDLICFGEAFLQGFDSLKWDASSDFELAITQDSKEIKLIQEAAKQHHVGVAFGYIEKSESKIFSSYLILDKTGEPLLNFRRVSEGWKEKNVSPIYCEGNSFESFVFMGRKLSIGLCGDLWYPKHVQLIQRLQAEIILWPVYVDFTVPRWQNTEKELYAQQAKLIGENVLWINSLCDGDDLAKGGLVYFKNGVIQEETLAGQESSLVIEL